MRTSVMQFEGEKEKPGEKHIREKPKEKELKSVGSTAAKGTCLKEGRFLKKARVGARRSRTGRKDKFWHLEMQVKAFLEKARRECHLALKEHMVEVFLMLAKLEMKLVKERIAQLEAAAPEGDEVIVDAEEQKEEPAEGNEGRADAGEQNKEPAEGNEGREDAGEKNKEPAEQTDAGEKKENNEFVDETAEEKVKEKKAVRKKSRNELLHLAPTGDCEERMRAGFEGLRSSAEFVQSLSLEELQEWKTELESKIDRLSASATYKRIFAERLMDNIGAKLMKPRRMTTLTMKEEKAGVKALWLEWDAALMVKDIQRPADQTPVFMRVGTKQVRHRVMLKTSG